MPPKSDAQLLREYAESGSESAFTELVNRHTDLVYSAALRQVPSPDLARDVAQNVFTSLARDARSLAGKLNPDASLAGWLCRCARNLALNLRRDDFRRHSRERQAMETVHSSPETTPDWDRLRPLLDQAISGLNETDHDALVLRFFKNQDLRSVGRALGMSEDTAQKRVARALDKLREHLAQHGITTTGAALAMLISANAVQAAPAGLAATISTAAVLTGTTLTATTTATATKVIAMTTFQKTFIATTLAIVAGAGIYEARQASQLREQNQVFQQQQRSLAEQLQPLQRERDDAMNRLAILTGETAETKSNAIELLKLRGEVSLLRKDSQELARLKADGATADQFNKAFAAKYPGPNRKDFLEQEALASLARFKRIANLAPDQEQTVRDLLLKQADLRSQAMQEEFSGTQTQEGKDQLSQSISNLSAQIDTVLSPDQQAARQADWQRTSETMAQVNADSELAMMQIQVGISREQAARLLPILYSFALNEKTDSPADPTEKANALATVLTPEQMEDYRKFMQGRNIRAIIQTTK